MMILESANSPPQTIGWYLIARAGDATVRVRSGMALGQDAAGELSLKPSDPLAEFTLTDDGGLSIEVVSASHELKVANQRETTRSLYLPPETPAQIGFLNNVLAIDTDFMSAAHAHDRLEVQIVASEQHETIPSAVTKFFDRHEDISSTIHRDILVTEARPPSPAATIIAFLRGALTRIQLPSQLTTRSAVYASVMLSTIVGGCIYFIVSAPTEPQQASTTATEPAPEASKIDVPQLTPTLQILQLDNPVLVSVSALIDADQLPGEATIDFALQSLKALIAAYPNDPQVRQGLTQLTSRLIEAARQSHERGDSAAAERLIAQAATSGVGRDEIAQAQVYLSTPVAIPNSNATTARAGAGSAASNETRPASPAAANNATPANAVAIELPLTMPVPPPAIEPAMTFRLQTARNTTQPVDTTPVWERPLAAGPQGLYPLAQLTAIQRDPPIYPRVAPAGAQGSVDLVMTVTESGLVTNVEVRGDAPSYFVRPARKAVQRWRFEPVVRDGKRVSVRTSVRLTFRS